MSDTYDRIYGQLTGLGPMSRPSTVVEALPIAGNVTTWVVQTMLHDGAPIVFIQSVDAETKLRVVLPPKVVRAILRQESVLRERASDRRSEERKAADAERARIKAARDLLDKKREERRLRRERQEASS